MDSWLFYLPGKYTFKAPYSRVKIVKFIVYSVCECYICSIISFSVVAGIKRTWHMSFVCARIKIIGYVGFVSAHIICTWLCLWVHVCFAIWLSATCLVCISNFLLLVFLVCCLTHNSENSRQFYIWHSEQCWVISLQHKESTFNRFIIVSYLY